MLRVSPTEAGEKLLRFLERRILDAPPPSALHRWIRTGQVRINGGRAKPFTLLRAGDEVRLPPFAAPRPVIEYLPELPNLGADLPVLAAFPDLLVLLKPAGLAVQPGTDRTDNVVDRLRTVFAQAAFIPAPVHRLDAPTSGLLLVARNQKARAVLHETFAAGTIRKEYLAWAAGNPLEDGPFTMRDILEKQPDADGFERMGQSAEGKEARAEARVCKRLEVPRPAALLHIVLQTGRTHQIRVQLAERGLPLIGDSKYGGPPHPGLLLHCFRLTLPDGRSIESMPAWPAPFQADIRCGAER